MESNRPMTCMLRVNTQSPGWEKSLTKVIKRVKDVSYRIDATYGIICISGVIDPKKLLTDIKKAGKHAVLIQAECGQFRLTIFDKTDGRELHRWRGSRLECDDGHSHSNCHSNNGYGYDYYRGYGPYPYYEAQLGGHGYIHFDPHMLEAPPAPAAAGRNYAPLFPPPSAPPLNYDPYNPNCNIM